MTSVVVVSGQHWYPEPRVFHHVALHVVRYPRALGRRRHEIEAAGGEEIVTQKRSDFPAGGIFEYRLQRLGDYELAVDSIDPSAVG